MKNKVELLSPAGDMDGFYGAIHAGADAVYLSGKQFGARAYAGNFTEDEIILAIRYAHLFQKKVYLTVNTLLKDPEMDGLFSFLSPLYQAGLDAVIVQDCGVLNFVRNNFPDLDIHISTQMTITGKLGCEELQKQGATRIVPARELSLQEIREIKKAVPVELECFIHGAMCYCYSGQCLFSSFLGERSGNRGRCAQPCRLPYGNGMDSDLYPLSLKDMNTLEHIPELIEAGIDSFKIEGRMKKPEYTAGVTSIYRKYIDLYYNGRWRGISAGDKSFLANLYTRSETESGYYFRQNGKEMVTLSKPSYNENEPNVLNEISKRFLLEKKKLPISVYASFMVGEPCQITLNCDDISVTVSGEEVLPAKNKPLGEEDIIKQLKKMGDYPFSLIECNVFAEPNGFLPVKALNELRRNGLEHLWNKIIEEKNNWKERTVPDTPVQSFSFVEGLSACCEKTYFISVQTIEQLSVVQHFFLPGNALIRRVYVSASLLFDSLNEVFDLTKNMSEDALWIALPYITRAKQLSELEQLFMLYKAHTDRFGGFLVRNHEQYAFLHGKVPAEKLTLDHNMYIWNREAVSFWQKKVCGFCIPLELKWNEQKGLYQITREMLSAEKLIYGYVPMMQSANCVQRTIRSCQASNQKKKEYIVIKDRYQKEFFVYLNCRECYNTIYNSVPLSLHKDIDRWSDKVPLRLDFTLETQKQTMEILTFFLKHNGKGTIPYRDYTTGHENRSVE